MTFKDNFTREDNQELEFDYSAFWTYAATFTFIFILPLLYKLKNRIFYKPHILSSKYKNCNCSKCKEKLKNYNYKKIRDNYNFSFYLIIALIIVLSIFLAYATNEVINNDGKIKGFNPFEILEVPEDATNKEVKKAYRKMSIKFHPDKNREPGAKAKFILITKAYEALTDPVSMENFKNFGNPDGGNMKIGIALPPFVYNKKNHMPILVLFLIFILIVLPLGVYFWYNSTQMYDDNGVRVDNQKIFYEYLNENILPRHMPFVAGAAREFANLKLSKEEAPFLEEMLRNYKDKFPKHKEISFNNKKAICLIYQSLEEKPIPECLKADTEFIMNKVPDLALNMYTLAMEWTHLYNQYSHLNTGGKFQIKNMGLNCLKTIIEFSQSCHQQIGLNSVPFMQIPHFTQDNYKTLVRIHKKNFPILKDFLNLSSNDRKEYLKETFTNDQIEDIESAVSVFPNYDAKIEAFVEGFDKILPKDFVTIKVSIKRNNLSGKDQEIGFPHSNSNINIYEEKAVVLVLVDGKIAYNIIVSFIVYILFIA